jgi:hypothetical protein
MTPRLPDQQPWEEMLRQAFTEPRAAARQFAQGTRTAAEAWALLAQLHGAADDAVQHWPQRGDTPAHLVVRSVVSCGPMLCPWRCCASLTICAARPPRRISPRCANACASA